MDVVAMHYRFKDMVARGAPQSSLGEVVRQDLARLGLTLAPDSSPGQMLFMRNDPRRPAWNRQDFLGRTFSDLAAEAAPTTSSSR